MEWCDTEISFRSVAVPKQVDGAFDKFVVTVSRADGLVDLEHVDFVVHGERVVSCAISIVVDVAWPAVIDGRNHAGLTRSTCKVDTGRSILRVFTGFEVPKEH